MYGMKSQNIKMTIGQNNTHSYRFLKAYRASDTRSHTSIAGGTWNVSTRELTDKFHDAYCKDIEEGNHCYLTEVPGKISPVKVDIDMRWESEELERVYDSDFIKKMIEIYYNVLSGIINYQNNLEYQTFVFEKPNPLRTGKSEFGNKDGIHIMIPFLNVDPVIERLVRDEVVKVCKENGIFDDMGLTNPVNDIIDAAVINRNNWQMYGSRKPKCDAYELTHIFTKNPETDELVEMDVNTYTTRQLLDILSIRNRDDIEELTLIKREIKKKMEPTYERVRIQAKRRKLSKRKFTRKKKYKEDKKKVDYVVEIVKNLDVTRVNSYSEWLRLGLALYHIHNVDDTLLDAWIDISKKAKGYEKTAVRECKKYWMDKIPNGNWASPPGIGSLKMWLKIDNPKTYLKITSDELNHWIKKSCNASGSSWDVAKVVWVMYRHLFVCTKTTNPKQWYYYIEDEHRWHEMSCDTFLRKNLSTEVYKVYNDAANWHGSQSSEAGDYHDEERKKIVKVMDHLKRTNFKQNVMKECMELFYDTKRNFISKLDQNHKLICFNNGVYDLSLGELREGRPEDMISFSTKIDYREFNESDEELMLYSMKMDKILDQIFPDPKVKDYVTLLLASFLDGSTKNELFHIWTGSGANGKSLIVDLFQECLGEYSCVLPVSLLTEKRAKAGAVQPELFATKGKRFAVLQEPGTKTTIQVGLLKELTGGDKIIARTLFKEPVEFKPQFKMVLTCNDLPKLPPNDGGTWRRVRATEFVSKFKDDPSGHWIDEENNPISEDQHRMNVENGYELDDTWVPDTNEYPIDRDLKDQFATDPMWNVTLMSMLIDIYKKYNKGEIVLEEPPAVLEFTRRYQNEQDKVSQFIADKIIKTKKENAKPLKIGPLYDAFQLWHSENYGGEKAPIKKSIAKTFEDRFGSYARNDKVGASRRRGWYNLKLVSSKLDVDDSDEDSDRSF